MRVLILIGLTASLGYGVLYQGGVSRLEWNVSLIGLGLTAALFYTLTPARKRARLGRARGLLLAAFVALPLIQLIPLPLAAVKLLSPARAAQLEKTASILGDIQAAPLSESPPTTLRTSATLVACVLVFLLVRHLAWRFEARAFLLAAPVMMIASFEAMLGLVQFQMARGPAAAMATGTYNNHNHFAGLLEMAFPLVLFSALAVWKRDTGRVERPVSRALATCSLLAVAALLLIGIVASLSRMGFLAALCSVFVTVLLMAASGRTEVEGSWRRLWPVAVAAAALATAFVLLPTDALIERFTEIAKVDGISQDGRAAIWSNTLKLAGSYLISGCGLGAYEISLLHVQEVLPMNTINFAHNDYLQILAEMGAPGFFVGIGLAALVVRNTAIAAIRRRLGSLRFLALGCAGALSAIMLHSLVDFNLYIPANAVTLAWIAGMGDGVGELARPRRQRA